MKNTISIPDRIAGVVIAVALVVVGLGFIVLGVTLLPVIGILMGIPVLGLAWHFLTPKAVVQDRIAGFVVPSNVMFHPGHSWAMVDAKDIITVGMDDFAAKLLGSVDLISLPKLGSKVKQGSLGWWFKADSRVIHMLSPVEGEVVEVNDAVADSPDAAFEEPYGNGWLFKVKCNNLTSNLKNMIPNAMVGEWFENVRQKLASQGLGHGTAPLYADGGEPVMGIARAVAPEEWDDLAREFFLTK